MKKENKKKCKWIPTISVIGALLTAIVALFTAILALFTVNEMKIQRIKAYEPNLVINSDTINLFATWRINDLALGVISTYPFRKKIDSSLIEFKGGNMFIKPYAYKIYSDFFIPIRNIGNGAAQNIDIKMTYDTSRFVELFNDFGVFRTNFIKAEQDSTGIVIYGLNDTSRIINTGIPIGNPYQINYIMPINNSNSSGKLYIPADYLRLVVYYEYFLFTVPLSKRSQEMYSGCPDLQVFLQYKDINDKLYSAKYKVKYRQGPTTITMRELKSRAGRLLFNLYKD